jgi:hypothetical protein
MEKNMLLHKYMQTTNVIKTYISNFKEGFS